MVPEREAIMIGVACQQVAGARKLADGITAHRRKREQEVGWPYQRHIPKT